MLDNLILQITALISAMLCGTFFITILLDKDEMEEAAVNAALKQASTITVISILIYCYYMLITGTKNISIRMLFLAADELSGLTIIFNFLEQKGIHFSIKLKNRKLCDIITYISTILGLVLIPLIFLNLKIFENKSGFIRYDMFLICLNFILISIMIPLMPNKKKSINREEVKENNKKMDKAFKIFMYIFCGFWGLFTIYVIYRLATR